MDLSNLSSSLKIKTNFNANSSLGLNDINGITGIVDNSVTSLQALIFSNDNNEFDDTDPTNYDLTGINSDLDKSTGFIFDLKKDYKLNLNSDITDHYVEDNITIQDHVSLKPITLEVNGVIAEINLRETTIKTTSSKTKNDQNNSSNIFNSIDSVQNRMGSLTQFAPNIVNQAASVYNTAKYTYSAANKFVNMVKTDKSQDNKINKGTLEKTESIVNTTKQYKYINWFKNQWKKRASFTIITPYGKFDNMYIVDLNATQPESSRYITNLSIKFKEIRKARIIDSSKTKCITKQNQDNKINLSPSTNTDDSQKAYLGHDIQTKVNNLGISVVNDEYTVKSSNSTITMNCASDITKIEEKNLENNILSFQDGNLVIG